MKLWGGRFSGQTDEQADHFHSSISFDQRLFRQDINGSIAHAQMLGQQGIIAKPDAEAIVKALDSILTDIESGALTIDVAAEDIHSFVETELIARIGDAGRRLHTGRSRNDQVALDMRMYVKDEIDELNALLINLLETLVLMAKQHTRTIMPGFTHLQKAQPITLAHHFMAYFQMFKRDYERLNNCRERTDIMPLGSGALASTTYPLDRDFVKESLGFSDITANSLDAVSDRDFCIEFVSGLSIIMMHLSRFCEELILWSTDSFGFITISDAYATGSSIMPQKKNPDMAELIRGKTGRVYGSLMGLLTMMKGLPLAYNKDMQEDKEAVFDAADTVKSCISVFCGMLQTVKINTDTMYKSALGAYTNATDAADWLVKKGMPFREAHEITGKLVLYAIDKEKTLNELSLDELKAVSNIFDETVYKEISVETCVNARNVAGGPAESAVLKAIEQAGTFLGGVKNKP
ncbi:MAG: argininosuccinate lyase [Treponema sp.]|jgi:argininosuccinate lyase|nr:argininosuccinate lyase [Treponema sp.]